MLKKKSLGAAKTAAALFLSLPVLLPALSSRAPAADWILPAGAGAAATPPASVPKAAEPARTGGNAPSFKKVMIIIFENTSYQEAASQPFFSSFAGQGALLTDFDAETHPSQGNYIALVSGDYQGVTTDKPVNLGGRQIGDLLEARGLTWKVYAQGYPGGCFLGARSGNYVRKHVPFLSFTEVQSNPGECANITDDSGLKDDIASGRLPDFSLFIPDIKNDGHDTGAAYADNWLSSYFGPLMKDPAFMKDMLLVVTFDEDDKSTAANRIFTALYGPSVAQGSVSDAHYTHYSLLRTIEDAYGLGDLGRNDASAQPITGIWK